MIIKSIVSQNHLDTGKVATPPNNHHIMAEITKKHYINNQIYHQYQAISHWFPKVELERSKLTTPIIIIFDAELFRSGQGQKT